MPTKSSPKSLRSSCIGVAFVWLCTTAFCQSTLDVRVTVQKGAPLPGAAVVLKHNGTESRRSSDAGGQCRFLGIEAGEYELQVAAAGYFTAESEIVIRPRSPVDVQIELAPRQQAKQTVEVRSADVGIGE
ncbi:MAG: carboxypeptidase regulatory-like domain-containing protein, partial [Acidobacteriaceae bacterium]|nr:carboxypeptidase regulatory-like domain-containing protein [Acidobacteriaceae bacterium]